MTEKFEGPEWKVVTFDESKNPFYLKAYKFTFKWPWYIKFLLLFKRSFYAFDCVDGFESSIRTKRLFGVVYVLETKHKDKRKNKKWLKLK